MWGVKTKDPWEGFGNTVQDGSLVGSNPVFWFREVSTTRVRTENLCGRLRPSLGVSETFEVSPSRPSTTDSDSVILCVVSYRSP